MNFEKIARAMIFEKVITCPFPWKLTQDWAWEILDFNGKLVCKADQETANSIMVLADQIQRELEEDRLTFQAELEKEENNDK